MESSLLVMGSILLGWILGYFPNRNNPYKDMKDLTNQFANLSAQLISQINMNSNQSMPYFPEPPGPEENSQEDTSFEDMLGGSP